jgi:hypothetical protein
MPGDGSAQLPIPAWVSRPIITPGLSRSGEQPIATVLGPIRLRAGPAGTGVAGQNVWRKLSESQDNGLLRVLSAQTGGLRHGEAHRR